VLYILWNEDIKNLIENKKKSYLRYLTTRSETDKLEYKRLVAVIVRIIIKLNLKECRMWRSDLTICL